MYCAPWCLLDRSRWWSSARAVQTEAQAGVAGCPGVAELGALAHRDDPLQQGGAERQLCGFPLAQCRGDVTLGLLQRSAERPAVGRGLGGTGRGVRPGAARRVTD